MDVNKPASSQHWDDDDIPEWTDEQIDRAELAVGDVIIREATGTLTKRGRPKSPSPKQQVTLRLDPAVIEGFRATGPGWQSRINAELRKALALR
jgi:uncharacterized protein (DUF4415 family)